MLLCCARGLPHSLRNSDQHALSFPNFSSSHQQGMNLHSKLYSYRVKKLLNKSKAQIYMYLDKRYCLALSLSSFNSTLLKAIKQPQNVLFFCANRIDTFSQRQIA